MTVPETETGTLPANPDPAPSQPEVHFVPRTSEAQKTEMRRAAFEKAKQTVDKPAPGASAEPAKAEGPPTFFTPKKTEDVPAFDPSKLPPELQPIYKSMQADATRKWEEAAQMRREVTERQAKLDEERQLMLEGQKSLIEALSKTRDAESQAATPSLKEQIQQLREEGRYAEADELVLKYVDQVAEEKAAPLVKEAQVNLVKSTFRETLGEVRMNNPVANHYWDEVSAIFDGDSKEMVTIRKAVLQSPETIRTFVPFVIDYIASRRHAAVLEQNYEAAVKAGIEKGIAERKAAAGKVPGRLIETGAVSRDSGPGLIDLKESFRLAKEQA